MIKTFANSKSSKVFPPSTLILDHQVIAHGYNKDRQPDLKQFLISLLCVDKSIPIIGKTEDGNASDKNINNTVLSSISKHLAKFGIAEGAYIYIADSAMVTEENLKRTGDSILFISRLPANLQRMRKSNQGCGRKGPVGGHRSIGVLAETKPTKNRPAAHYKARESEVELHGKKYRALVVHSSAHDKRRKKRIDRELEADRKALESKLEKLSKQTFHCLQDAEEAMNALVGEKSKYHFVEANVEETKKYKRGRPAGWRKVVLDKSL